MNDIDLRPKAKHVAGLEDAAAVVDWRSEKEETPDHWGDFWDGIRRHLDERSFLVIALRFRDEKMLREVAQFLEISMERVRQIQAIAIERLRDRAD